MSVLEVILIILTMFAVIAALIYFFNFSKALIDSLSVSIYGKPFFVHVYLRRKDIDYELKRQLEQKFSFYRSLSIKQKKNFHHRVSRFLDTYEIIPRHGMIIDDEVKLLIAATYVTLTFGMRKYILTNFNKILVYPEEYFSKISSDYHKGEFNPALKVVVFSWKHFLEGHQFHSDSINLGYHEFSHVVHHHSMRYSDVSSLVFKKYFQKIVADINHPKNKELLISSNYFRDYAFTNYFEFISVVVENYFETPLEFKQKFPVLYKNVSLMLNHKHPQDKFFKS